MLIQSVALAGSTASQVIEYLPGNAIASFQNTAAALGLPVGNTGFGALTPFNPHFSSNQIMIIGAGGSMTLKLDKPVTIIPSAKIGVFSNVGIVDEDPDTQYDVNFNTIAGGGGIAGSPTLTFSPAGFGFVSVSSNGMDWSSLGASSFSFGNPTNYYTDTNIALNFAALGTQSADFFKPFGGTLASFAGLKYRDAGAANDMVRLLNGSAGGTWLDISSVPLAEVNYVKFDVPVGGRMVIDAVTAVPEPVSAGLLVAAAGLMVRRRHRGMGF
ncbi:MAG: PEP-CTERM sorting domain-containing protein [Burkholderiales bacterium]|nr:PEP-CTERM sorting domain-containing protein [Phycisphaerae bacterium]